MKWPILISVLLPFLAAAQVSPLPGAHAHNDYEQERPLLDALQHGFTSVEADVHLIDGELYVVHDRPDTVDPRRTLEKMYLQPLLDIVRANKGTVYPNYNGNFYLMIDIKTEAEATYQVLKEQLLAYREMLTTSQDLTIQQQAVTVFLSGNRPLVTVLQEQERLAGIDGRPGDLGKGYPASFMPVISDNYRNHLQWRGEGPIPKTEQKYLKKLLKQVHQEGKKLRLWASPENEAVWKVLHKAGVDFLNTDKLATLQEFLEKK